VPRLGIERKQYQGLRLKTEEMNQKEDMKKMEVDVDEEE